jgi:hypothetical protein
MGHYGIGPLTAGAILAELGDARRFSSARAKPSAMPVPTSPCISPTSAARLDTCRARDRRRCAWRSSRRPRRRPAHRQPRPPVLRASRRAPRRQPRVLGRRPQAAQAPLPQHTLRELGEEALTPRLSPRTARRTLLRACHAATSAKGPGRVRLTRASRRSRTRMPSPSRPSSRRRRESGHRRYPAVP